jgi:hypothetical protein
MQFGSTYQAIFDRLLELLGLAAVEVLVTWVASKVADSIATLV